MVDLIGIYGIHNKVNDKWYVGQSIDIKRRQIQEASCLCHGGFHGRGRQNYHIVHAWDLYGADAFEWVVLEECTREELDEREIYWINAKDSLANGYNQTQGGGGRSGYSLKSSTKEKISAKLRGRPLAESTKKKMSAARMGHPVSQKCREAVRRRMSIPVEQIFPDGTVRVWSSATDAARAINANQSNITACCKGKLKRTGGFAWRYAEKEGEVNGYP